MGLELLSTREASDFVEAHGIDMTASRMEVLHAITKAVSAMPFHNLHFLATHPDDRKPPNEQAVKAAMLKGQGGLCFVKQPFVGHLLRALGYVVEVVPGSVTHPGNHIVIVVHDVQAQGDRYVVEVGCGYPSCSAVRIDGEDEHEGFEAVFTDSFLEYRYVKTAGESLIRREHRGGDPPRPVVADSLGRSGEVDGWRRYFDFFYPPSTNGLEQLAQGMQDVCTLPDASPFLASLRAVRWVKGKMIAIKDAKLLEEAEDGQIVVTELQDVSEIRDKLILHFPEIEACHVDAALEYWHRHIQAPRDTR